ncbi:YfcC family protein [Candidatus Palauibacter sp.]|uniref:YfcC family protein n=1 Tax=Candidatus Palauibacter sp. TaxID=3101350 RepID=UPI003B5AF9D0
MRRLRFPHPLTLLTAVVLAAAALSYVLPAGEYDRRDDPETGRSIVVPGTYQEVEANRIGVFDAIVAIPRGMAGRADVVFLIFLIGGAFAVFDATGALRRGIAWLVERLQGREILAIPVVSLAFAAGGVTENLQEEIIPLVPALMLLTRRLGYSPMVGVAVSAGSAFVGSAFSPINPFQVLTAQEVADVAPLSGSGFRLVFLAIALGLWIWWTMGYAARTRVEAETVEAAGSEATPGWRDLTIFGIVASTFGVLVWGLLSLGWDFDHMSALFFVMGVVVGIVGRLGITGTAEAYAQGFKSMGYAALLIGFANAIYVVMDDARIIDTIVRGLFVPLAELPLALSAIGMSAAQGVLHFAVPSVSGQAVLTLPVLVPLSDLLGLSRQITILAYQYGAGLCELITPTNGALMAILAASGVRYEAWLRFVVPRYLMLMGLGAVALVIAIAIGYS